ncbi:hypothetical protein L6452_05709 [Arctium lappa]|uniref:Uncharacterized protein n=1 Tax=Arctium lappa TaxID=4217 RepID=A0ACB9EI64_ARCLA|nr:hypothetical protein L6452_05709 [Arctium lappa]
MLHKPKQAEGFHAIVDFLKSSHIAHALTVNPTIYVEHQTQFWAIDAIQSEEGNQVIKTRVCDKPLTITEGCIRIHLRLDDASGITFLPKEDLFAILSQMGYEGPTDVFKFYKNRYSPQWRFFVHTLQHCISRKTTGWSEFSSTLAYALVCLATSRKFVQEIILKELTDLPSFQEVYVPKPPKGKVLSNMKRPRKDFSGQETPLFSTMMVMSPSHGEAKGSQPTSDHLTDDLPTPFHSSNPPPIPIEKPTSPITKIYIRKKVQKVPSLPVPSPPQPLSPLMEHSPLENINRETTGISPNPKKVLTKEQVEHVGSEAHTTDFAQSAGQDSVNIPKTFPTATSGEQSSKGPRCQETKGVERASARQKTPTKTSKDPSSVVNTPKGGEDRYNYEELMETIANVNMDVLKQGAEIEEMKLIGAEGETFVQAAITTPAEETEKAAEISKAAETEKAAEISKAAVSEFAAETVLSREEIEIAETLVKAKLDTPKATPKAKGVVIKEVGLEKKRKEISVENAKKKGKEKVVESAKASKKQSQIALDEELARKVQAELEKEEETQSAKDREIALKMAAKLNEEYQKSLKSAAAAKKVINKASRQRLPLKTRQRQPSKTYLENQERRKMINFLKGAIGVLEGMFTSMSFGKLEELYQKEMAKLKGDFIQRVEVEGKMKESHDLNIQQPFPDSEEGTPSKDKEEVKQEETLAQQSGAMKRKKSIATKPKAKRIRTEEAEKESERREDEPTT